MKEFYMENPKLRSCEKQIENAVQILCGCFKSGGKVLTCGNGGSAADSGHIVGELMKGFLKKRPIAPKLAAVLQRTAGKNGMELAKKLQCGLPAIDLTAQAAIASAAANDLGAELVYAQQVLGYGRPEDVLIAISTSGNAQNVINAAAVAKALEMKVISLTGRTGGKLAAFADAAICVEQDGTPRIQELPLPIYHYLCEKVEQEFFCE